MIFNKMKNWMHCSIILMFIFYSSGEEDEGLVAGGACEAVRHQHVIPGAY